MKALSCLLLLASPALALPPISASLGYSAEVVSRRSFDLVDMDDHLPKMTLSGGYRLPLEKGSLGLDLVFSTGGSSATAHTTLHTSLSFITLEAAATYRYSWLAHVEPYARLSAGPGWASLQVDVAGGPARQTVTNFSATGLLGLSFPFLLKPSKVGLEFDLGVGYSLRPVYRFEELRREVPSRPTGEEIRDAPLYLGRLDLSGIAYRLGVGVRL